MAQTLLKNAADFETQLAAPVSASDTTATLVSVTDDDGNALANGSYCLTVDLNSASKEYFTCTLTGTALTNIKSITRQGVSSVGFARPHRRGAKIVITDWVIIDRITDLLDGTTDFDADTPLGYDGTASITTANQFATKAYVDGVAIAGAPDASTSVKGISKLSSAPASPTEPIAVGDNDPRVPTQGENDALAGTSGTPSSSNKYVTNDDTTGTGAVLRESERLDRQVVEALEALTAGNFVKIITSGAEAKAAKIFGINTATSGYTVTAPSGTPTAGVNNIEITALTSTLVVALGKVGNNSANNWLSVVAGTISGKTITWGTPVYINKSSYTDGISSVDARIMRNSNDSFVIMSKNFQSGGGDSIAPMCYVGTVSGTTVTLGSGQTLGYTLTGTQFWATYDMVRVDTDKFVFMISDTGDTDVNAKVATVDTSARTLSAGSEFQVNSGGVGSPASCRVHLLSTNRILFTYGNSTVATTYRVATISGTTITNVATNSLPDANTTRFRFMKGATDNEGLAVWYDATNTKIAKVVESGGTLTFSLTTTLSASADTGLEDCLNNLQIYNSETNKWIITAEARDIRIATLFSDQIYLDSEILTNSESGVMMSVYDTDKIIQIANYGTVVSPYILSSFDYNDVVGTAHTTVSATQDVQINNVGMADASQSSLTPGGTYYLNASGTLTLAPSSQVNGQTFTNKKVGTAISATKILLQ